MKRCKDNCEGWDIPRTHTSYGKGEVASREGWANCPWCGSSLIDEPEMITRTITVLKPMTERPKYDGIAYYMPSFSSPDLFTEHAWTSGTIDEVRFRRGIYPTSTLAIMAAKAMIGEE